MPDAGVTLDEKRRINMAYDVVCLCGVRIVFYFSLQGSLSGKGLGLGRMLPHVFGANDLPIYLMWARYTGLEFNQLKYMVCMVFGVSYYQGGKKNTVCKGQLRELIVVEDFSSLSHQTSVYKFLWI